MLFSIVIPVYNVEKYLDECLQSVVSEVDKIEEKCEIILVDDGSTDNSGKICDEYERRYPEVIKVFHKENQGLLMTRRYGFKRTMGNYIISCDSDDSLENGMLEELHRVIVKYNEPDIILINHNRYNGDSKESAFNNIFTNEHDCSVPKADVLKEYLVGHSIVSMCGKICKRSCFDFENEYEKFECISTGEDTLQSIELFNHAQTFVYLNEALYNYRCGSGMTEKFDEQYYFTFKLIFHEIEKQKNNWRVECFDELFAIKVLQTAGRAITQARYNNWKSLKEERNYLKSVRDDSMMELNYKFLDDVKDKLQFDHYVLLCLLDKRLYIIIIIMLIIKNLSSKDKGA